ncbi:uncharacterized protein ACIB01_011980 [Guaruba guarouba]
MPRAKTNIERAMYCLHEARGNVLEALELLRQGVPSQIKTILWLATITQVWTHGPPWSSSSLIKLFINTRTISTNCRKRFQLRQCHSAWSTISPGRRRGDLAAEPFSSQKKDQNAATGAGGA